MTLDSVVDELFTAGEQLGSSLRKKIVARGAVVEAALLELIGDESLFAEDARGLGYAPVHAVTLLGDLRSTVAIPRILEILRSSDPMDQARSAAYGALKKIGAPVLEPCLAAFGTASDDDRVDLAGILSAIGVRDERIYEVMLAELARDPESSAGNFVEYGDVRALVPLGLALDAYQFVRASTPFSNHAVIELCAAIEELGGTLTAAQAAKRTRFTAQNKRWRLAAHGEDDEPVAPGRNDPCPCGSGKKYKKCHLAADESASRIG